MRRDHRACNVLYNETGEQKKHLFQDRDVGRAWNAFFNNVKQGRSDHVRILFQPPGMSGIDPAFDHLESLAVRRAARLSGAVVKEERHVEPPHSLFS